MFVLFAVASQPLTGLFSMKGKGGSGDVPAKSPAEVIQLGHDVKSMVLGMVRPHAPLGTLGDRLVYPFLLAE